MKKCGFIRKFTCFLLFLAIFILFYPFQNAIFRKSSTLIKLVPLNYLKLCNFPLRYLKLMLEPEFLLEIITF